MGLIKKGGALHVRGAVTVGAGVTSRFTPATGAADNTNALVVPHSTAAAGTTFTLNGQFGIGQHGIGTPTLIARLNGTTYFVAIAAA